MDIIEDLILLRLESSEALLESGEFGGAFLLVLVEEKARDGRGEDTDGADPDEHQEHGNHPPSVVVGEMSPYPTVVAVTIAHENASPTDVIVGFRPCSTPYITKAPRLTITAVASTTYCRLRCASTARSLSRAIPATAIARTKRSRRYGADRPQAAQALQVLRPDKGRGFSGPPGADTARAAGVYFLPVDRGEPRLLPNAPRRSDLISTTLCRTSQHSFGEHTDERADCCEK